MTAWHSERRPMKIRRSGRHATPSQVEKVAERAGKAAPAVAIAGALVAAPQAHQALTATGTSSTAAPTAGTPASATAAGHAVRATLDSVVTHAVTVSAGRRHAALPRANYTVRAGDTLSGIAEHRYGRADAWPWLYHENDKKVVNPDLIYVGERLFVPATAPARYTLASYQPRHARASATGHVSGTRHSAGSSGRGSGVVTRSTHGSSGGLSGNLSCAGLERLWEAAGGNPAHAFIAAEIAMAESGGRQYALSPTDDKGYWQINWSNGALSTYDAFGNARAAIILSGNGADWSPWTTYTSGAYYNRC